MLKKTLKAEKPGSVNHPVFLWLKLTTLANRNQQLFHPLVAFISTRSLMPAKITRAVIQY